MRKTFATGVMVACLLVFAPADSEAHWCPEPGVTCDRYFACMDSCDWEFTSCWLECSGYPNPYRDQCQDACIEHYNDCMSFCGSNCFYFCP